MKTLFSRFGWHFDRIFGNNKNFGWQISIIVGILVVIASFIGFVGFALVKLQAYTHFNYGGVISQTIGLVLGASTLQPMGNMSFPLWWKTIGILLGAVFFSGVTITFLVNWLRNRQEAYKNGTVRYYFENHLLFLGGSRIILPMIKTIAADDTLNQQDIVVLTSDEVEKVRVDINRYLSNDEKNKLKITVLSGDHYDKETLKSIYTSKAKKIYIAGDYLSGSEHDSENMACWNAVKELCEGRKNVPCHLYFSRSSSVHLFRRRTETPTHCLDTTIINWLEMVAQRVLVHNGNENNYYPALDRNGIDPSSDRIVHLVLVGMTPVSFALATTAAHICHFPNSITPITFDNIASKRTKITFIAPNMKKEMGFVTAHLSSLFKMSHYSYVKDDVYDPHIPEDKYGNFLDVEWEFVDGNLTEEWVVKRLLGYYKKCVTDEKSYLTMAFCDMQADRNIAAASYLPYEFHKIIRDEETHKVNYEHTIPLLIYQSENEELVRSSQASAPMCENMFSFGSMRESYDPSIRQRINEGKRINYIYSKDDDYVYMTSSQDVLDTLWKKSYLEQVSNIYCANHIGVKLRSVGINEKDLLRGEKIPDKLIDQMAAVEHNRWNMEKLLMGYDPIEASRRQRLKAMEPLKESDAFRTEMEKLKKLKKNQYVHHCIAPFGELLEEYKKYDYLIVRNLTDAC